MTPGVLPDARRVIPHPRGLSYPWRTLSGGHEEDWLLFVDESGRFEEPDEPTAIAGLLLRSRDEPVLRSALRKSLCRAFPLVRYPQHATELRRPTAYAAAAMLRTPAADETQEERDARRAAAPAVRVLSDAPPRSLAADFMDAVRNGRMPTCEALNRADAWLSRRAPAAWSDLEAWRRRCERHMAGLLSKLHEELDGHAWVLLMGGRGAGEEWDTYEASPRLCRDAYLRQLEALFERTLSLLRGRGTRRRIIAYVATRPVTLEGFGSVELWSREVMRPAEAAAVTALGSDWRDSVRLIAGAPIVRYDEFVHPGVVLADFLGNRLRMRLWERRDWTRLAEAVARVAPLPIEATATLAPELGALPTLGMDGPARRCIQDAAAGRPADPTSLSPRWNRDQAQRWIELARLLRRAQ